MYWGVFMHICSLFGHREIWGEDDFDEKLECAIIDAIENLGVEEFWVGGYGKFDFFASIILRKIKKIYPHIRVILVLAYLEKQFDDVDKKFNQQTYDEIIYPPLESVPKRYAIVARNKWMVDESDHIIFYVNCSYGGAFNMLEYAFKKKKSYLNIGTKKLP